MTTPATMTAAELDHAHAQAVAHADHATAAACEAEADRRNTPPGPVWLEFGAVTDGYRWNVGGRVSRVWATGDLAADEAAARRALAFMFGRTFANAAKKRLGQF